MHSILVARWSAMSETYSEGAVTDVARRDEAAPVTAENVVVGPETQALVRPELTSPFIGDRPR